MPKSSKKTTVSSEALRKKKHQEAIVKTASDLVTALREKAELTVDLRYANAQISDLQSRLNQTLKNLEAQQKIVSALQGNLEVAGADVSDLQSRLRAAGQREQTYAIQAMKDQEQANQLYQLAFREHQRANENEQIANENQKRAQENYNIAFLASKLGRQNRMDAERLFQDLQAANAALQIQQAHIRSLTGKFIEMGQNLGINEKALVPVQQFANSLAKQENFQFSDDPAENRAQLEIFLNQNGEGLKQLASMLNGIQDGIARQQRDLIQRAQEAQEAQANLQNLQRQREAEHSSFEAAQAEAANALQRERLASAEALDQAQNEALRQIQAKDVDINRLSEQLASAEQARAISSQRINQLSHDISIQRSQADEASADLAYALQRENDLRLAQEELQNDRDRLQVSVNRLNEQVRQSRESLPIALRNMREHDRQIVQRQIDALTSQIADLSQERIRLREQVRQSRSELDISEGQRSTIAHRLETLQMERDQLLARFRALQDESSRQLQEARAAQRLAEEALNHEDNQRAQQDLLRAQNEIRMLEEQLRRRPPPPPQRIDLLPPPEIIQIHAKPKRHYGVTRNPIFFETFVPTKSTKRVQKPVKKLFSRNLGF